MGKTEIRSAKKSTHYDVAIVGGGVSGIYSGWRLVTAAPGASNLKTGAGKNGQLKVAVFEGSNRIGGRLLSARPPSFPATTTCELGGMRFVSSQTLIRSLVENELGLSHYEQVVNQPNNIVYLRGKQLRASQLQDPSALPYNLDWAEAQYIANNDPVGLIGWAIAKYLPGVKMFEGKALQKYLQTAKVDYLENTKDDGPHVYEEGFWTLLARALSPEAYVLARTIIGYDCLGSNANALDLIFEYFKFTKDVRYYSLNDGYESVPWCLEEKFKAAGGEVVRDTWVAGFDKMPLGDGNTGVVLHFRGSRPPVTARCIILAMPRRSLQLLHREGPVFGPEKAGYIQPLLDTVRAIPLYKLFLVYDYPWWNAVDVRQGRSLTDTPARQIYYWPVDPCAPEPPTTGQALVMAYNDATNVDFWKGLSGATERTTHKPTLEHFQRIAPQVSAFKPRERVDTNHAECQLRKNWDEHKAPTEMVMEMHRQLKQIHDIQYAPEPRNAAYMDWSVDPYGGGVHLWNRSYKSWEKLYEITKPVVDFPCYICGEAYSRNQTWVEGALETAEIVLQKHLGLAKPPWITKI
jgi:monoamine oxidase